ncbi:MAG: hypothetical protein KF774_03900 [Planctomyces sp.]|nr:hypothetical protein [Planctomyces sp.]
MTGLLWILGLACLGVSLGLAAAAWLAIRRRNMHQWLGSWHFPTEPRRPPEPDAPLHVFLAVCDHYEPECYGAPWEVARERVRRWRKEFPRWYSRFRDDDGRPPQHTFFFPQDEYRPEYLDELKQLCDAGFGDVDVHLHHDRDTPASLEDKLAAFRDDLFHRHGLLRRDPVSGEIVYGFIHGNWALCNSLPGGELCGVDSELSVLLKTGCYADFTLPSAPSPAQTRTINSIYYAADKPGCRKSHDVGTRARVGVRAPDDHLLMIQGPLLPDWQRRKFGLLPRIENGDIHGGRPATLRRFAMWRQAHVHVAGRPDWLFMKLHTHGCKDGNIEEWLGPSMAAFHEELERYRARQPQLQLHYVTAWEMAQLVRQAESGATRPTRNRKANTSPASFAASLS